MLMATPEEIHSEMAAGYARQRIPQAEHDANRRANHFQVRLSPDTATKLRAYMASHSLNANQALQHIVTTFFN
jgi:hypothetical protein